MSQGKDDLNIAHNTSVQRSDVSFENQARKISGGSGPDFTQEIRPQAKSLRTDMRPPASSFKLKGVNARRNLQEKSSTKSISFALSPRMTSRQQANQQQQQVDQIQEEHQIIQVSNFQQSGQQQTHSQLRVSIPPSQMQLIASVESSKSQKTFQSASFGSNHNLQNSSSNNAANKMGLKCEVVDPQKSKIVPPYRVVSFGHKQKSDISQVVQMKLTLEDDQKPQSCQLNGNCSHPVCQRLAIKDELGADKSCNLPINTHESEDLIQIYRQKFKMSQNLQIQTQNQQIASKQQNIQGNQTYNRSAKNQTQKIDKRNVKKDCTANNIDISDVFDRETTYERAENSKQSPVPIPSINVVPLENQQLKDIQEIDELVSLDQEKSSDHQSSIKLETKTQNEQNQSKPVVDQQKKKIGRSFNKSGLRLSCTIQPEEIKKIIESQGQDSGKNSKNSLKNTLTLSKSALVKPLHQKDSPIVDKRTSSKSPQVDQISPQRDSALQKQGANYVASDQISVVSGQPQMPPNFDQFQPTDQNRFSAETTKYLSTTRGNEGQSTHNRSPEPISQKGATEFETILVDKHDPCNDIKELSFHKFVQCLLAPNEDVYGCEVRIVETAFIDSHVGQCVEIVSTDTDGFLVTCKNKKKLKYTAIQQSFGEIVRERRRLTTNFKGADYSTTFKHEQNNSSHQTLEKSKSQMTQNNNNYHALQSMVGDNPNLSMVRQDTVLSKKSARPKNEEQSSSLERMYQHQQRVAGNLNNPPQVTAVDNDSFLSMINENQFGSGRERHGEGVQQGWKTEKPTSEMMVSQTNDVRSSFGQTSEHQKLNMEYPKSQPKLNHQMSRMTNQTSTSTVTIGNRQNKKVGSNMFDTALFRYDSNANPPMTSSANNQSSSHAANHGKSDKSTDDKTSQKQSKLSRQVTSRTNLTTTSVSGGEASTTYQHSNYGGGQQEQRESAGFGQAISQQSRGENQGGNSHHHIPKQSELTTLKRCGKVVKVFNETQFMRIMGEKAGSRQWKLLECIQTCIKARKGFGRHIPVHFTMQIHFSQLRDLKEQIANSYVAQEFGNLRLKYDYKAIGADLIPQIEADLQKNVRHFTQNELVKGLETRLKLERPRDFCLRQVLKMAFYMQTMYHMELLDGVFDFYQDDNGEIWLFYVHDVLARPVIKSKMEIRREQTESDRQNLLIQAKKDKRREERDEIRRKREDKKYQLESQTKIKTMNEQHERMLRKAAQKMFGTQNTNDMFQKQKRRNQHKIQENQSTFKSQGFASVPAPDLNDVDLQARKVRVSKYLDIFQDYFDKMKEQLGVNEILESENEFQDCNKTEKALEQMRSKGDSNISGKQLLHNLQKHENPITVGRKELEYTEQDMKQKIFTEAFDRTQTRYQKSSQQKQENSTEKDLKNESESTLDPSKLYANFQGLVENLQSCEKGTQFTLSSRGKNEHFSKTLGSKVGPKSGRSYSSLRHMGNFSRSNYQSITKIKRQSSNKSYLALITDDYDSRNGFSLQDIGGNSFENLHQRPISQLQNSNQKQYSGTKTSLNMTQIAQAKQIVDSAWSLMKQELKNLNPNRQVQNARKIVQEQILTLRNDNQVSDENSNFNVHNKQAKDVNSSEKLAQTARENASTAMGASSMSTIPNYEYANQILNEQRYLSRQSILQRSREKEQSYVSINPDKLNQINTSRTNQNFQERIKGAYLLQTGRKSARLEVRQSSGLNLNETLAQSRMIPQKTKDTQISAKIEQQEQIQTNSQIKGIPLRNNKTSTEIIEGLQKRLNSAEGFQSLYDGQKVGNFDKTQGNFSYGNSSDVYALNETILTKPKLIRTGIQENSSQLYTSGAILPQKLSTFNQTSFVPQSQKQIPKMQQSSSMVYKRHESAGRQQNFAQSRPSTDIRSQLRSNSQRQYKRATSVLTKRTQKLYGPTISDSSILNEDLNLVKDQIGKRNYGLQSGCQATSYQLNRLQHAAKKNIRIQIAQQNAQTAR